MDKMLAIFFLVTVIVSLPPTDGEWSGVAKLTALIYSKDEVEINNKISEINETMIEEIKFALDSNDTSFTGGYDPDRATLTVTFQLNQDPVENTRAMVSVAEKAIDIDIDGKQLTPIYTVENDELYYPVTRATTLCELREIMEPCQNGYLCNEDSGACDRVIAPTSSTPTPAHYVHYEQDTNLFVVLGIAGSLSVIFLGFLIIYCWRKGITVQNTYRQNEKKAKSKKTSPVENGSFMT